MIGLTYLDTSERPGLIEIPQERANRPPSGRRHLVPVHEHELHPVAEEALSAALPYQLAFFLQPRSFSFASDNPLVGHNNPHLTFGRVVKCITRHVALVLAFPF